jgi:hypothetical protein
VSDRNLFAVAQVFLAVSVLLLGASSALAYAGPGADIAFLSYAMALAAWALAAFSAVLLWPIYALLRKIRGGKREPTPASQLEKAPEETQVRT